MASGTRANLSACPATARSTAAWRAPAWWSTRMLGTGFSGEPREPVAGAIAAINAQDAPVVACDVPSGVDASTGEVAGEAVRARLHGHLPRLEGRPARGARAPTRGRGGGGGDRRARAARPTPAAAGLISERVLELYPHRTREGSKFTSGVVVVAGGGARADRRARRWPRWRPSARARATCRWRCPRRPSRRWSCALLEAMTRGLPETRDGCHTRRGRGAAAGDGGARRRGGAGPGPGPLRRRGRRSRASVARARSRRRC